MACPELLPSRDGGRGRQKSAEGIVGSSTGLKARACEVGKETELSMTRGDADRWAEKPGAASLGNGRNPREDEVGASRVTARLEDSKPETKQLMEAVVERENMVQALKRVEANK